jgi:hypothetical protein
MHGASVAGARDGRGAGTADARCRGSPSSTDGICCWPLPTDSLGRVLPPATVLGEHQPCAGAAPSPSRTRSHRGRLASRRSLETPVSFWGPSATWWSAARCFGPADVFTMHRSERAAPQWTECRSQPKPELPHPGAGRRSNGVSNGLLMLFHRFRGV